MNTASDAHVSQDLLSELRTLVKETAGLPVQRKIKTNSKYPCPTSQDLERELAPRLKELGYARQVPVEHPVVECGYKYDFWRESDGVAMEIMGYRADDEVYKDLLKFHVHLNTRVGVLWVPRYKWVKEKRSDRNFTETKKAKAFADTYMDISNIEVRYYDWDDSPEENTWLLRYVQDEL